MIDTTVYREVADWCDELLTKVHRWEQDHPFRRPVDVETLVVARGLARRLVEIVDAGYGLPDGANRRLMEAVHEIDVLKLQRYTGDFGRGEMN